MKEFTVHTAYGFIAFIEAQEKDRARETERDRERKIG